MQGWVLPSDSRGTVVSAATWHPAAARTQEMTMGEHTFFLLPMTPEEEAIPWPSLAGVTRELDERPGWVRRTIPVQIRGKPSTMEAMCRGELAVNAMLGDDLGFAISSSAAGFRLSCGGRVFARCADAMIAAEAMMAAGFRGSYERPGFTAVQAAALKTIWEAAERRGEILRDRVFPS